MAKDSFISTSPADTQIQTRPSSQIAMEDISSASRRTASLASLRLVLGWRTLAFVVGIGSLLRLMTLGVQSLWLDEGVSFWTVHRNLPGLSELLSTVTRPLYYWMLYPAYRLGTEEWLLRLPSALAGIASLVLLYLLGRELFDRPTALLATALLALSPLHLWYSQEARFYALVVFLTLGATYFAIRALKHNHIWDWVLFGVLESLGLWTESGAIWYLLAINLSGLLMIKHLINDRRLFGWILAQAIAVALYVPQLSTFISAVQGSGTSWIPPATIRELLRLVSDFSGGFMQPAWFGILSMLAIGFGLALGSASLLHEAHSRWRGYAILLPWLVIPIAASFILSQPYYRPEWIQSISGSRQSIFLTRNLIAILSPLLLLLARSLVLIYRRPAPTWRWVGLGLLGGVLTLYAIGYFHNHLVLRKEDYRSAARLVSENAAPGDLVLASPGYIEQPIAYYYYNKIPPNDLSLESVRDGVVESRQIRQDISRLGQVEEDLQHLILQHERVWLVTNDNAVQQPDPLLINFLELHARLEQVNRFKSTQVWLFMLPPAEASNQ